MPVDPKRHALAKTHLEKKCNGRPCGACGANPGNWTIHDLAFLPVGPSGMFATIPVECKNCGNLLLFSTTTIGITDFSFQTGEPRGNSPGDSLGDSETNS
jgi:hypothetical protein